MPAYKHHNFVKNISNRIIKHIKNRYNKNINNNQIIKILKNNIKKTGICIFKNCETKAGFGKEGCNPEYCGKHKKADYIDVKNKKCIYQGCNICPLNKIE